MLPAASIDFVTVIKLCTKMIFFQDKSIYLIFKGAAIAIFFETTAAMIAAAKVDPVNVFAVTTISLKVGATFKSGAIIVNAKITTSSIIDVAMIIVPSVVAACCILLNGSNVQLQVRNLFLDICNI